MNNFNQYYPLEYSSNSNSNSNSNSPNFDLANAIKQESSLENDILSFNQQGLNFEIQQKFQFESTGLDPALNHQLDNGTNVYYSYSNAYNHQDPNVDLHHDSREDQDFDQDIQRDPQSQILHQQHQHPPHDHHVPGAYFKSDLHPSQSQPTLNLPQQELFPMVSHSKSQTNVSNKRGPEQLDLEMDPEYSNHVDQFLFGKGVPIYSHKHPVHSRKDSQQPIFMAEDHSSYGSDHELDSNQHKLEQVPKHLSESQLSRNRFAKQVTESNLPDHDLASTISENTHTLEPLPEGSILPESRGSPNSKKKRRDSGSIQDNENELKRLTYNSLEIPVDELIDNLRAVENDEVSLSPSATEDGVPTGSILGKNHPRPLMVSKHSSRETQKQVFAMIWLLNNCSVNPTSVVPRNKIYSKYVYICSNYNLFPLTPANLGKLVKILFPQITVRRLGVRGQSKYHYCGIKFINDDSDLINNYQNQGQFGSIIPVSPLKSLPDSTSRKSSTSSTSPSPGIDLGPHIISYQFIPLLFSQLQKSMKDFVVPIDLPSIHPYVPENVDVDIADTLYSLYKIYLSIMIESFQFNRLEKLFTNFNNFNSILTSPVFKLYVNVSIAPWIKVSDMVGFRHLVKVLVGLINQGILFGGGTNHPQVIKNLKIINDNFIPRFINSVNNKIPKSLILIKLNSVKLFQRILSLLLKLVDLDSLLSFLNSRAVLHNLGEDFKRINFRLLINHRLPVKSSHHLQVLYKFFEQEILSLFTDPTSLPLTPNDALNVELENGAFLNRLIESLNNLFTIFSKHSRLTLITISKFLNDILKELNLVNPGHFNHWYLIKTWVEEFMTFWFLIGGLFPDLNPQVQSRASPSSTGDSTSIEESKSGSAMPSPIGYVSASKPVKRNPKILDLLKLN